MVSGLDFPFKPRPQILPHSQANTSWHPTAERFCFPSHPARSHLQHATGVLRSGVVLQELNLAAPWICSGGSPWNPKMVD